MDITVSDLRKGGKPHDLCFIDIARLNYFASDISSDGEILIELFKFQTTLMASIFWFSYSNVLIKATSSSILNQRYARRQPCSIPCFQPIKTSMMHKNNIHKTKMDKVETCIFAKTFMFFRI